MKAIEQISRFARRWYCNKAKARGIRWLKKAAARWRRRLNRQSLDAELTRKGWRGRW